MFGYILPDYGALSEEDRSSFQSAYCGLCKTLRDRYGLFSGITVSYDLTFVAILLASLKDEDADTREIRCPVRPLRKREARRGETLDYAADLNLMLTYYKLLDDWEDDGSRLAKAGAEFLKTNVKKAEALWPAQSNAIRVWLEEIRDIERSGQKGLDAPANSTGRMMGTLLSHDCGSLSELLSDLGGALGRFIYTMDAYCDLDGDRKHGRYNPLIGFFDEDVHEEMCLNVLQMIAGDIASVFEVLPLDRDVALIKNIIYSGIWNRYREAQDKRRKGKRAEKQ